MNDSRKLLETEYQQIEPEAQSFSAAMVEQLTQILRDNRIPLGVQIESRVKTWRSISEKIERKTLGIDRILALEDLVGLRLLLLFRRDVDKVCEFISAKFAVIRKEDKLAALDESQFGYQSIHVVVTLPNAWLSVPSLAPFKGFKAEIQIRTLAQHIWAAASHVLQYKRESSVPLPVRRSIHRVSALLETVDLEFDRVLDDKEEYLADKEFPSASEMLNVDLLQGVLDEVLPPENKFRTEEDYAHLLDALTYFEIQDVAALKNIISENIETVMEYDQEMSRGYIAQQLYSERASRGIYYTHCGLVLQCLANSFGQERMETFHKARKADNP